MEKKYNAETYIVKEMCECGGEFVFDGIVLTSYPPKFPHTCNKCGKTVHLDRQYPSAQTEIGDEVIEKPTNEDIHDYASEYSHKVWEYLMKQFETNKDFYIGANDVSDFVLNAILDAMQGMKTFDRNETTTCNLTCDDIGEFSSLTVKNFKEEDIRCNYYFPLKDWVTREKNGELTIHTSIHEPWKDKVYGYECWINGQLINLGQFLVGTVIHDDELLKKYEHLTWDDEPVCIKTYSDDEMCTKYFGEGK